MLAVLAGAAVLPPASTATAATATAAAPTAAAATAAASSSPWAHAALRRASVAADGTQAAGSSFFASISGDGRYVAFRTGARNLFPGLDTYAMTVVKDRTTGVLTPVTVTPDGKPADGGQVIRTSISTDGRYVAFCSMSTNLVPGLPLSVIRVFVRDVRTGTTVLASVDENGGPFTTDSAPPSISPDGHSVAFIARGDVFVRDLVAGHTVKVSVPPAGQSWNLGGNFDFPALSTDGRYVAFTHSDGYFASVYLRDRVAGTTVPVSVDRTGTAVYASTPAISGDGRYVTFASSAANVVAGSAGTHAQVYRRDQKTGRSTLVSLNPAGAAGNGDSGAATISANGRYVAFTSTAADLVAGDTDGKTNVFVRDLSTASTTRVDVAADGTQPDTQTGWPQPLISSDGRSVVFDAFATNLVSGDTNATDDIFVADAR